jgi:hypothetical protein
MKSASALMKGSFLARLTFLIVVSVARLEAADCPTMLSVLKESSLAADLQRDMLRSWDFSDRVDATGKLIPPFEAQWNKDVIEAFFKPKLGFKSIVDALPMDPSSTDSMDKFINHLKLVPEDVEDLKTYPDLVETYLRIHFDLPKGAPLNVPEALRATAAADIAIHYPDAFALWMADLKYRDLEVYERTLKELTHELEEIVKINPDRFTILRFHSSLRGDLDEAIQKLLPQGPDELMSRLRRRFVRNLGLTLIGGGALYYFAYQKGYKEGQRDGAARERLKMNESP